MKKVIIILISIIIIFTGVSFYLYQTQVKNLPAPQNFLILGLDPRNDQLEKTQVTDTIIFAHLSENSQEVKLISLPRDLWFYPKSFKINQLYQESDSFSYLKENFSLVLGQKIDNVVVITTQDLMSLVDLVGGVDVYLENGFKDDLYPNPDYINSPSSNIPIYKTIEFQKVFPLKTQLKGNNRIHSMFYKLQKNERRYLFFQTDLKADHFEPCRLPERIG